MITKDLGAVTAFGLAKEGGLPDEVSKEEYSERLADYWTVGERAKTSAEEAEAAKTEAETARNQAQSAQTAAETAVSDAESARTAAQTAATDAQTAKTGAESAQTAAEAARNTAVNAVDGFAAGAQQALDSVNEAGGNWKSLAERQAGNSEAWAIGQRGGVDVGTQDATYHNNAKYYAEQTATDRTTAQTAATNASQSATAAATSASQAAESARTLTIDTTLTQSGQAAAADVVGGKFTDLKGDLNKFYSKETETGSIFRFDETDGVLKVVTDSEVTVGNQNILPNAVTRTETNPITTYGITYYKNSDGSIRVYGTATANVNIWINQQLKIPRGKYTLSGCPSGGSSSAYRLQCAYRIDDRDTSWLMDYGSGSTAELNSEIDNIRCAFIVFSGATIDATVFPQLECSSTKSNYALCDNQTVSANTEMSINGIKTIFANSDFGVTLSKYGWTNDILNVQNEVNALSDSVDEAEKTATTIGNLLTANVQHFNIDDYSLVCIHHDNFSRTMTGWEIGMNAGGTDTGNNYEYVTASDYNDGLSVDDGATFATDNTRTNAFSLRKIANAHSADFAFETNAPTINNPVCFGYNVTDIRNFVIVTITKRSDGFSMGLRNIKNGSFGESITYTIVNNIVANVCAFYVVKGWLYFYLDEQLIHSAYVGDMGSYLYLASYKGYETHFDFVNVFNLANKVEWNPNHVLDTGVSNIPLITTSANDGGYTLQEDNTRWSNYADKFLLNSTDPLVHNGHRSERSVSNLAGYTGNLRHLKISFDVYFPSTSIDAERSDIMMQMHDRDGTYRGFVPFILNFDNNKIKITLASTHAPKGGAADVVKWVAGAKIASISTDEWHRFELEIKERYDEDQNPFVKISIDSKLVFESRKPNCFNDLLGSSPQYGIYKNLWGEGVTTFERYFDNFKMTY